MPERIFLALLAAVLWLQPSLGNAQGIPMRKNPLPQMGAATPLPYGAPAAGGAPVAGYEPAAGAYGEQATVLDPNHKLQPGDQLSLKILEDREAAVAVTVGQTGDVIVDPIPYGVKVSGMSVTQASNQIKLALEKDYYYTATVRINLERAVPSRLGTVTISGKVGRVGPIPIMGDKPLMCSNAILLAGGFQMYADERRVRVTRREKDGSSQRFTVDVKAVLNEGKVEKDMVLQDGDSLFVDAVWLRTN
jgi:protein involved in polysaccharide export with SLBB domain